MEMHAGLNVGNLSMGREKKKEGSGGDWGRTERAWLGREEAFR